MSNFDWGYPNTVWFGNGRIKDLPKACKVLDIKNPLFVTDKDLAKTKMVEETLEINKLSLIHISEPPRDRSLSRMPSSA